MLRKIRFSKIILSILLALTLCGFAFVGCSSTNSNQTQTSHEQIQRSEYPNVVAENAQINDQYADIAKKLTEDNINYFIQITKIPHPSEHLDQIRSFLINEFTNFGFSPQIDETSQSIYVDIPASANYTTAPKVIIQAHMDMVATVADGSNIDLSKDSINTAYDQETGTIKSAEGKTNIGADDGVGMSLILSMAKNYKEYEHPTMRFLFTADEEIGLVGASKLSASVLDCDYLINYDDSRVGQIVVASGGTVNGLFSKDFSTEEAGANDSKINVKVKDLIGGHTGSDVPKNRIHASHLILNCLKELADNNIEYKISYLKTGTTQNSFPTSLDAQFYVNKDKAEQAKEICSNYIQNAISASTDDTNASFAIAIDSNSETTYKPISSQDSVKLVNGLLKVPDGVVKMSEVNPEIAETSFAIGVLNLANGQLNVRAKLRTSNNEVIDRYLKEFPEIAKEAGVDYKTTAWYYGFPNSADSKLANTMLESYKQVDNFEGFLNECHGGLELSHFKTLRPDMQMISVGSDIKDEHMLTETYYTKSQAASTAALLYTITHLG